MITPVVITRNTEKTCIDFTGFCLAESIPSNPVIRLRRAGLKSHVVEYPGTVDDDGVACFEWGDLMWNLPSGRYIGDLFDGEEHIGSIQFQVNPRKWRASVYKERRPKPVVPCHDPCD